MKDDNEFRQIRGVNTENLLEVIDYGVIALRRRIAMKNRLKNLLFFVICILLVSGMAAVAYLLLNIRHVLH